MTVQEHGGYLQKRYAILQFLSYLRGRRPGSRWMIRLAYEYGRDFLHKNGDFFLDYFYHSTREYDLLPY